MNGPEDEGSADGGEEAVDTQAGMVDALDEALGISEAVEEGEEVEHEIDETEEPGDDDQGEEGDEGGEVKLGPDGKPLPQVGGERNPDGTFKPAAPKKPLDPINDPIPEGLKPETNQRIRSLVKIAKDVTSERDTLRTDFDTIVNGIRASGSTPEQYGEVMSFMTLFNSPNPESQRQAYELVEQVADRMATMLGIDRKIGDPLERHADLKTLVANKQMTPEVGREVARMRDRQNFSGQVQQGQREREQSAAAAAEEDRQARAGLTAFEKEMKASDPLWERKRAALVPTLRETFKHVPKSKWVETFKAAYKTVRIKPLGKNPGVPAPASGGQPLRGGKQPAGGRGQQPGTMMDAMNAALDSLKR